MHRYTMVSSVSETRRLLYMWVSCLFSETKGQAVARWQPQSWSFIIFTLEDGKMEPENDGLFQMIFLFNWVFFRFQPLILQGVVDSISMWGFGCFPVQEIFQADLVLAETEQETQVQQLGPALLQGMLGDPRDPAWSTSRVAAVQESVGMDWPAHCLLCIWKKLQLYAGFQEAVYKHEMKQRNYTCFNSFHVSLSGRFHFCSPFLSGFVPERSWPWPNWNCISDKRDTFSWKMNYNISNRRCFSVSRLDFVAHGLLSLRVTNCFAV